MLFGPHLESVFGPTAVFDSISKLEYAFSGFHSQFIRGHWWEGVMRNSTVWPTLFLLKVFVALKVAQFHFFIYSGKCLINRGNICLTSLLSFVRQPAK